MEIQTATPCGAQVLVSGKLLGKDRAAGETLTPDEVARLPEKNLTAMVNQGMIALLADGHSSIHTPTPREKRADQALRRARKRVKEAEQTLEEITAKLAEARTTVRELTEQRRPHALQAAQGDTDAQGELDRLREKQRCAEVTVGDLEEAIRQAEEEVRRAEAEVVKAEQQRHMAELNRLVDERLATAHTIEQHAEPLAAAIQDYLRLGLQIGRITSRVGGQLNHRWRLETYLNHVLGLEYVERRLRKPLSELERSVLQAVLKSEQIDKEAA